MFMLYDIEDYALNETHALLDGNEDAQEQPLGAQNAKASNDQTPNTWREGPLVPTTAPFPTEGSMLSDPFKVLTFLPCEWTGCDAKLNSVDTLMRHLATHCYRDASTQKTVCDHQSQGVPDKLTKVHQFSAIVGD